MTRLLSLATALPVAVTLFAPTVHADTNGGQANGVLSFPVTARHGAPLMARGLSKRTWTSSEAVGRLSGMLYTIDVKFGSPGQSVPVQFDTGSSELVANPVCSDSSNPTFCRSLPRFTMSTTIVDYGVQGATNYEPTSYASFEYVGDYIGIGSARITQQIFGATYASAGIMTGVLGAAPDVAGWESPYPFVIDNLRKQGLIESKTFSLNLRGLAAGGESLVPSLSEI